MSEQPGKVWVFDFDEHELAASQPMRNGNGGNHVIDIEGMLADAASAQPANGEGPYIPAANSFTAKAIARGVKETGLKRLPGAQAPYCLHESVPRAEEE